MGLKNKAIKNIETKTEQIGSKCPPHGHLMVNILVNNRIKKTKGVTCVMSKGNL